MNETERIEVVEKLKLELNILKDGGYGRSVRTPRAEPVYLRDSVTCLNFGRHEDREPCDRCFLMEFVPQEYAHRELPCHHIRLNDTGETLASLEARGDKDHLEAALGQWLKNTILELQDKEGSAKVS
ncbi:MAG: hypothetical protein PHX83_10330 [Acidobacteriia bacterium]|nr:hypothetical protein [Terriglobia bacterium]